MSLVEKLIGFGFRQVIGEEAASGAEAVTAFVFRHFSDHSQTLPNALLRANERAWQALGVALAGDGLLDQIRVFFASGDDKGIREQVQLFLQGNPGMFRETPAQFRAKCLAELRKAQEAGLLKPGKLSANEIAIEAAGIQRYVDPKGMVDGAERVVRQIADDLAPQFPNLATLLRQPVAGGPPLLVASFSYFFRREVETNEELARGLLFDGLRQLSAGQERAFAEVGRALDALGPQFDLVFEQLDRIETAVVETKETVRELTDEFRAFLRRQREPQQAGRKGSTFSSITAEERELLLRVLKVSRCNPSAFSTDLLDQLGDTMKTERMFDAAGQAHEAAAAVARADANRDAEAAQHYKAYLSACDGGDWEKAADFLWSAARLRPDHYQPFHPSQFQFVRILGAGAFGTVFHCRDEWNEDVAIKSFRSASMGTEAWTLRSVQHPAIIGVRSRGFGNLEARTRPYIVMDFFPGVTLDQFAAEHRPLKMNDFLSIARQVAEAVHAAHTLPEPIFHCDLKPANIMVQRKPDGSLVVKVIDFGLAKCTGAVQTSRGIPKDQLSTGEMSRAGTERYAPPEQTGEAAGAIGPYSDVYAWGKTFMDVLFGHLQPGDEEWEVDEIPEPFRSTFKRLFAQCVRPSIDPNSRFPRMRSFAPVLEALKAVDPTEQATRLKDEQDRKRREQEEAERQRQELAALQQAGAAKLAELARNAMDRTGGKPTEADNTAAKALVKQYRLSSDRAKEIIVEAKAQWTKDHPPRVEPKVGNLITNSVGMKLAWIPPGTFLMGSPKDEEGRRDNEQQHKVTLTQGCWLGVYPVTRFQFFQFVQESGYQTEAETSGGAYGWTGKEWKHDPKFNWKSPGFLQADDHPVVCISWNDAVAYCEWLSKKEKLPYRLPTEAEWEYACRAGTTTSYNVGRSITTKQANFNMELKGTSSVGSYPCNAWGLHDMHGNVWEWCGDWFGAYSMQDAQDPKGAVFGDGRVLRGGSFLKAASNVRSASRFNRAPVTRTNAYGFRVARTFTP